MASEVKRLFEGSWSCCKSENVEAIMDKMRVPAANRAAWGSNAITTTISVNGEEITMSGKAGPRDYTVSFELGQDFKVDGGMIDSGNSVFSEGVFKTVLTPADKTLPKQTVTRRIVDGKMVQTQEIDGVVSTRYFNRSQ